MTIPKDVYQLTQRYLDFIQSCREKTYPEGTITWKHHINPRHNGGTDNECNLISLSFPDHITAHKILWEDCGNCQNLRAIVMLESIFGKGHTLTNDELLLYHQNQRENSRNFYKDPKNRKIVSDRTKKLNEDPEYRKRYGEKMRKYWADELSRKVQSEIQKKRYENPEERKMTGEAVKKYYSENPDGKEKRRKACKKSYEDPNLRKKVGDAVRKSQEDQVVRQKMRDRQNKRYENPEERKKQGERSKKRYENPEARKKMSEALKLSWIRRKSKKSE